MTVQEITSTSGLTAIEAEWLELWSRSTRVTPFQSPAWLIPWWTHVGEGELWTLAFRDGSRLLGVLPMYVYRGEDKIRKLLLLGTGSTDILDGVFEATRGAELAQIALEYIFNRTARFDQAEFLELDESSPLLAAAAPDGVVEQCGPAEFCPILDLPARVDQLEELLPRKIAHNLSYYRRKAEREGGISYVHGTPDNALQLFDRLVELHSVKSKNRGESGLLDDPNVLKAHRQALPKLAAQGSLLMYGVLHHEEVVAVFYGFIDNPRHRRQAYYYLSGFKPELASLSPGMLAVGFAIEQAIEVGAKTFNFLKGRGAHKYHWGAQDIPLYRRWLVSNR